MLLMLRTAYEKSAGFMIMRLSESLISGKFSVTSVISGIYLILFQFVFLLIMLSDAGADRGYENWRLIAKSSLIVTGKLSVPESGFENPDNDPYIEIRIGISSVLKGKSEEKNICFYYAMNTEKYGGVTRKNIISFHGREVTVFLAYSTGGWSDGYYLSGYTPDAVRIASPSLRKQIVSEVKSQNALVEQLDKSPAENPETEGAVISLIETFFDKEFATRSYYLLILMGKKAVPSIIRHMDDRRILKVQEISLLAGSERNFELLVHYGPETVADVLAIILTYNTGESYGSLHNGASEIKRATAIFGWKVWLAKERKKGLR